MIRTVFEKNGDNLVGITVSGHAMFGEYGQDIVCAAVTSALQMCANGITHVAEVDATVVVEENRVYLKLPSTFSPVAEIMLRALKLQFENIKEDYPKSIDIQMMEV